MILPLAGLVLGAIFGVFQARRRGGKTADLVQYGTVYALIFGLIGLFALVILSRMSGG